MQFSSVSSRRLARPRRLSRCGKAKASLVVALGLLETVPSRSSAAPWGATVGASLPRRRVLQPPTVPERAVPAHAGSAPAPSGLPVLRRSARRWGVSVRSEMQVKPCAVSAQSCTLTPTLSSSSKSSKFHAWSSRPALKNANAAANPSFERTCPGVPGPAAQLKRWVLQERMQMPRNHASQAECAARGCC